MHTTVATAPACDNAGPSDPARQGGGRCASGAAGENAGASRQTGPGAQPAAVDTHPAAQVVLVSAIASGQGKTSVTAALARKLCSQGKRVRVFKTGADFIDPMLLARASGKPVYSLDLWLVGLDACRALLAQAAREADVILIEGVMGLYDGTPSSADLARAFGVPVLLVIDASAMAQTAGAVVLGLRDFGPVSVAGVVANRVGSPGHARMVAHSLREVPLLASLPRQSEALPERHLGLTLPDEVAGIDALLDALAAQLDLDEAVWQRIAQTTFPAAGAQASQAANSRSAPITSGTDRQPAAINAGEASAPTLGASVANSAPAPLPSYTAGARLPLLGKTIAIAQDAAFAFIYPANLDCLRALGASLIRFSPLRDEAIPPQADALYLPGGYPELHAAQLATARRWQSSLRAAHARGMPILAECGGMMALAETLCDQQGQHWPMAGLLPGRIVMQPRLAALGPQGWHTAQGLLRGHAFHFSRFDTVLTPFAHTHKHAPVTQQRKAPAVSDGADAVVDAAAESAGEMGEAIYRSGNLTASYFHAYFPSCPASTASLFLPQPASALPSSMETP